MADHSDPNAQWKTLSGLGTAAITALLFVFFLQFLPSVAGGEPVQVVWNWVPSLDVRLSFWIDGLSLLFALLITGIGAMVMLYAAKYLAGHPQYDRFAIYLF